MFPISDSQHKPSRFPFVNISLIVITVIVFFMQITSPDPEAFIQQYALIPAHVDWSNYRTLFPFITSMFLHGGFLHIISNMVFLWVFGDNAEGEFPPFVYLFVYLGAGLVGGFAQYILMPGSTIPMLGASGAVAGALGAYFALFPHHKITSFVFIPPLITTIQVSAGFMLGYWILLQVISGVFSIGQINAEVGGIAFFAHIGGFVFGYVIAKLLPKEPELERVE
jgi:membrane associated rhomboid family serine protease